MKIATVPTKIRNSPAQKSLLWRMDGFIGGIVSSLIAGHRPSKTGVNALVTPQSTAQRAFAYREDARVRPAHDTCLLRLDTAVFNDAFPLVHFLDHVVAELRRCHRHDR